MLEDIDPPPKRLRRTGSPGSSSSNTESGFEVLPLENYGVDNKNGAEEYLPSTQTELETSLPNIKTDSEAIADYEASKARELIESGAVNLHRRYEEREWVKGKSSIYVDAFNLALGSVLEDESHLFDEAEMEVFNQWRELCYESQYLYVRFQISDYTATNSIGNGVY